MVYRNYSNQEDEILHASPWETKPENLRNFMDKIWPLGGLGNEAIELGLWHANHEAEKEGVSQVILIGDAPPNTIDEVKSKRAAYKGEDYWKNTKFRTPTHYSEQVEKLRNQGILVHAFYVDERAETSFKEIASKTGGRCEFLDISTLEPIKTLSFDIIVHLREKSYKSQYRIATLFY